MKQSHKIISIILIYSSLLLGLMGAAESQGASTLDSTDPLTYAAPSPQEEEIIEIEEFEFDITPEYTISLKDLERNTKVANEIISSFGANNYLGSTLSSGKYAIFRIYMDLETFTTNYRFCELELNKISKYGQELWNNEKTCMIIIENGEQCLLISENGRINFTK